MKKLLQKEEEPHFWKLADYLKLIVEGEAFAAIVEVINTKELPV